MNNLINLHYSPAVEDESSSSSSKKRSLALLDWQTVNKKMPWGVIILLGGGFALADACKVGYSFTRKTYA